MKQKLSRWAKENQYTYQGAWNRYKLGLIPNAKKLSCGQIIVDISTDVNPEMKTILYCRVSNPEQKLNLQPQSERLKDYAIAKGYQIDEIYKEIASGLNDNRKQLNKILDKKEPIRLLVEHKDRLTRFGFNYIEKHLKSKGSIIEVVNHSEDSETDIMTDFVSLVTSFCARLYRQRRSKRKTQKIIDELKND